MSRYLLRNVAFALSLETHVYEVIGKTKIKTAHSANNEN